MVEGEGSRDVFENTSHILSPKLPRSVSCHQQQHINNLNNVVSGGASSDPQCVGGGVEEVCEGGDGVGGGGEGEEGDHDGGVVGDGDHA